MDTAKGCSSFIETDVTFPQSLHTGIQRRHGDDVLYYIVHQLFWLAIAYFTIYLVYVLLAPGLYEMRFWGRPMMYWRRSSDIDVGDTGRAANFAREAELTELTATVDEAVRRNLE